jgi:hypothetical protein
LTHAEQVKIDEVEVEIDPESYNEHGVELLESGEIDVNVRPWSGRHDLRGTN